MDFQKNWAWIVMAVVTVVALGTYLWVVPSLNSETAEAKRNCAEKAAKVERIAKDIGQTEDLPRNQRHATLAKTYARKVDEELAAMRTDWENRKIEIAYKDAPLDTAGFDSWLAKLRQNIKAEAAKANLKLPADFDKLMFDNPATDNRAADATRHRAYRLRQIAILDEVIKTLGRRYPLQAVGFEKNINNPEPVIRLEAGVIQIEKISILSPEASAERARQWGDEVQTRARLPRMKLEEGVPLPYQFTSVDVQFLAPLVKVPALLHELENNPCYTGVITRVDFQRALASPFPDQKMPEIAQPGPAPAVNTYYFEGPVRVLITLDLYEYDKRKEQVFAEAIK